LLKPTYKSELPLDDVVLKELFEHQIHKKQLISASPEKPILPDVDFENGDSLMAISLNSKGLNDDFVCEQRGELELNLSEIMNCSAADSILNDDDLSPIQLMNRLSLEEDKKIDFCSDSK
jgi:hypothetical protein